MGKVIDIDSKRRGNERNLQGNDSNKEDNVSDIDKAATAYDFEQEIERNKERKEREAKERRKHNNRTLREYKVKNNGPKGPA
jgi:hypothetical protein